MSSKLHRGGVPMEPIGWRSVGPNDDNNRVAGDQQSATGYVPPQALESGRRARPGDDFEEKIRAAHQQGVQEGHRAARQEMGAQVETMNVRMARAIEEMSGMRQRFRHEAEEDVVALALAWSGSAAPLCAQSSSLFRAMGPGPGGPAPSSRA